jgi:SAM-dependent methyltransferase
MRTPQWHYRLYDEFFAQNDINTKALHASAKTDVAFLMDVINFREGSRILDAPCGTGRHALQFAKKGHHVTGIDISWACIKIAKENCKGLNVNLLRGNILNLKRFRNKFDAALNLYNSFGYFPDEKDNEKVMEGLVGSLKQGGKIVIEVLNRDMVLKDFKPVRIDSRRKNFELVANQYDFSSKTCETHMVTVDRKTNAARYDYAKIRLYSKTEMMKLMKKFRLKKIRVYGGYDGEPFDRTKSLLPIFIAEKE